MTGIRAAFLPFVLAPCLLFAQRPAEPEAKDLGRIEGRVVNAITGEPIRRVNLMLSGGAMLSGPGGTSSDAEGRFVFQDLAPGTYTLTGERAGFLRAVYGARSANTTPERLRISAGQILKDLEFKLTPQAVITGKVVDDEGDPVVLASVRVLPVSRSRVSGSAGGSVNDLGEFRIANLAAGRYLVAATPLMPSMVAARGTTLLTTYYPSAADLAGAALLEVRAGQELSGLTIMVRRGRVFRVEGTVVADSMNVALSNIMMRLASREVRNGIPLGTGSAGGRLKPDGTFELLNVVAGDYHLTATTMSGKSTQLARVPVVVTDADIKGLVVKVAEPLQIAGVMRMEGQEEANFTKCQVILRPAEGVSYFTQSATPTADGAFELEDVPRDKLLVTVLNLPSGAYVKSVRIGGAEAVEKGMDLTEAASNVAMEVLVSPSGATVDGSVVAGDKPSVGASVILLPDPPRPELAGRMKMGGTDPKGKFKLGGLAPGDYRIHAFEDPLLSPMSDPDLMKSLERTGTKLSLGERESKNLELTLEKMPELK